VVNLHQTEYGDKHKKSTSTGRKEVPSPCLNNRSLEFSVSFHQMKEILILHKIADFKTILARHLRPRIAEAIKA
jgi:hypothetical protein